MTDSITDDQLRIAAHLTGSGSTQERASTEAWIAEREERSAELARLRRVWEVIKPGAQNGAQQSAQSASETALVEALWIRVVEEIDAPSATPRVGRFPQQWVRTIGAVATTMVTAIIVVSAAVKYGHWSATSTPPTTYATATGEWKQLPLRDGSQIVLAPRSRLTVSNASAHERTLTLSGRARFDVTASARASFTIRTNATTIRVLGTSFDVSQYPDEAVTHVAVFTGKIAAVSRQSHMQTHTITAGQYAVIGDSLQTMSPLSSSLPAGDWRNGRIRFDNAAVRDVLRSLGQWYGLDVRLADTTFANQHVSMTLNPGSSADAVAKLSLLLDMTVTMRNGVVTLSPKMHPTYRRAPGYGGPSTFPPLSEVGR